MRNRLSITIAAGALLMVVGLAPGAAGAHNGGVQAGCYQGAPVAAVNLSNYNGTNTVSVKVDGGPELTAGTFGSSYSAIYQLGDPYVAHQVVYSVVAHDDPTNSHGWSPSGTLNVPACLTPTTTTAAATTTTSSTTTTSTTIAETTTTVPATTTTDVDDDEETTTTVAETTTTVPGTTTTLPAVTTTTAGRLPDTGTTSSTLAGLAATIIGMGALLMFMRRRA